jgi:hypothetical protein
LPACACFMTKSAGAIHDKRTSPAAGYRFTDMEETQQ